MSAVPREVRRFIISCTLPANTPANVDIPCIISLPPTIIDKDSLYPFSGEVWAVRSITAPTAPSTDVIAKVLKNAKVIYASSPFSAIASRFDKTELVQSTEAVYNERQLLSLQVTPLAAVGASAVRVTFYLEVGVF